MGRCIEVKEGAGLFEWAYTKRLGLGVGRSRHQKSGLEMRVTSLNFFASEFKVKSNGESVQ